MLMLLSCGYRGVQSITVFECISVFGPSIYFGRAEGIEVVKLTWCLHFEVFELLRCLE